jgi:hypothetical protein
MASFPAWRFWQRTHWLVRHAAAGAVIGWLVLLALLVTDAAGLWTLLKASDMTAVAVAAIGAQFAAGFAAFAVATACALPPDRPAGRTVVTAARPARISSGRARRE